MPGDGNHDVSTCTDIRAGIAQCERTSGPSSTGVESMRSNIAILRADLIELRLKQLGGTGNTLLERARSLEDTLGAGCMRRIRAVAERRDRCAFQFEMKAIDRIDLMLFLEDCEAVDRQLVALLRRGEPARASARSAACEANLPSTDCMVGLGEYMAPIHEMRHSMHH